MKILSQKQILNNYRNKIIESYKRQQIAGMEAIKAILEIGNILLEARNYNNSLTLNHKDAIWREFIENLGFSPASVSRYIKIATHPILSDQKFHRYLPSSVYSLYEISSIEAKHMLRLIQAGTVYSEMGRSEILSLRQPHYTKQAPIKKINLLQIKISKDLLNGDYHSILNEIEPLLNSKGLSYEYGSEIKKIEKSIQSAKSKVEQYVFKQAKRYFGKLGQQIVERKGIENNLWKRNSKLSFKAKAKKVGYTYEEISSEFDTELQEIAEKYLILGQEDMTYWNNLVAQWYAEGMEKYGKNLPPENFEPITTSQEENQHPILEFSKRRKNSNFTGVKFKV
jgi:hypothetical protein